MCLIASTTDLSVIPVEINNETTISMVYENIKTCYIDDISSYMLWKVEFPINDKKNLQKIKKHQPFDLAIKEIIDSIQLDDQEKKIGELYPSTLENHIHFVIQIHSVPDSQVYVFVDDTNLFIQGKYVIRQQEQMGSYNNKRKSYELNEFRSQPPDEETLWRFIKEQEYEVFTFNRNARNKEKDVDSTLSNEMAEIIYTRHPSILVLIFGKKKSSLFLNGVVSNNNISLLSVGTSKELKNLKSTHVMNDVDFIMLDDYYKKFSFGYDPPSSSKLESFTLTGNHLLKWRSKNIVNCFQALNLFRWLKWINDTTVILYFKRNSVERAKKWHAHPYFLSPKEQCTTLIKINKILTSIGTNKIEDHS
ncbi:hypothetical protein C1645_824698 [Glomus cerebriforme]|uniref:Uncharacterized protein n=1 Tax=Glomus cerebriforme TaxID=658196 RepID=A0A397SY83_9GLOM|nr:hypothetical protein C1645_824698 [Glomus cerebriforme]